MTEMTTDQALQMLDQAVSTMQLNRDQHGTLQMALQTLAMAVAPPAPEAEKAAETKDQVKACHAKKKPKKDG